MNEKPRLITRREAIKYAFLGNLALLPLTGALASSFGGGSGPETDPGAILRAPPSHQEIAPTVDIQPLRVLSFDENTATPPFEIADPALLRGFGFYPGTAGSSTVMVLARQPTDGPIAFFLIDSGHIFGVDWQPSTTFGVLTYDPNNTYLFGNDTIILGDSGIIAGGPGLTRIAVLSPNLDISLALLGGVISLPGNSSIATSTIGVGKGAARPDHTHNITTSGLGTPAPVGLAGSRGTLTSLPRFDHVHKALPGTVALINADETQANLTVPNADTNLKTFALSANTYSRIITEAEGYAAYGALSVNQVINVKIKYGGVQVGQTMALDAGLGAVADIPFPAKASALQTGAVTIAVTIGSALADANTTIFLNSLRIYGVV